MSLRNKQSIRLGLCCIFRNEPIKFRTTTARVVSRLTRKERLRKLSDLCSNNAYSLRQSLEYCVKAGIGAFRVSSDFMPLRTHPGFGYAIDDLPDSEEIRASFSDIKRYAKKNDIRLSFHPDQFVVLNSPREDVVAASVGELLYQCEVSRLIGADVVNIHGGGGYGDKPGALKRFELTFRKLPAHVRRLITVENDDRVFSPADLVPLCESIGVPLVYDVHHHRCLPDALTVEEATKRALASWNREPLFHISSPIEGWDGPKPTRHHDYIDIKDFPRCWSGLRVTVEVEAKAKELAIAKLTKDLRQADLI